MRQSRWVWVLMVLLLASVRSWADEVRYVGASVCAECHAEEYKRFTSYAKKAKSSRSIKVMQPKLTGAELAECYVCHTTGYGKPGGFVDFATTPQMADAGCEVCHGPGSAHAQSGDPADIAGKPAMAVCESCHNGERVKSFNFKPLMQAGAH